MMVVFHWKPIFFWNMVALSMCCSLHFHYHSHFTFDVSGVLLFMFILPQPVKFVCSFYHSQESSCVVSWLHNHSHSSDVDNLHVLLFVLTLPQPFDHFLIFSTNVLHDYYTIAKKAHSCFSCSLCNSHLNLSNVLYAHFVISI